MLSCLFKLSITLLNFAHVFIKSIYDIFLGADGKATGVVHKIAEDSSHKLCGSFKIMSDGIITRFTGMSKADWNNAMRNAEAEYKAKYEAEQTTTQESAPTKVAV